MALPENNRAPRILFQKAVDYRITGTRSWTDISRSEQDEYLLGCFMGEALRLALEKRLDLLDRTASSVADGLLGPFRQHDINTGEAHYRPESPDRAQKVMVLRIAVLRDTPLGVRLSRARARQLGGSANAAESAQDPTLHFYSVGHPDMVGLHILDEADYGGLPAVNRYKGKWNDWSALEAQQAKELQALKDERWEQEMAAPSLPRSAPVANSPTNVERKDIRLAAAQEKGVQAQAKRRPLPELPIRKPTAFQKLLWNIWPPEEPKIALRSAMEPLEGTVSKSLPVYSSCRAVLRNTEIVLQRVRHDGYAPDELGLVVVQNILADHLCSGNYHVYRGMLSMAGQQLMSAFNRACSELEQRGYATPEENEQSLQHVRKAISEVG
ncbi:MAG: hypothetical protein ABI972_29675 [Acidobacteriota bacterium]